MAYMGRDTGQVNTREKRVWVLVVKSVSRGAECCKLNITRHRIIIIVIIVCDDSWHVGPLFCKLYVNWSIVSGLHTDSHR